MEQGMITVLSPIAKVFPKAVVKTPRLETLNGKVMGILWNTKPNGDIFLRRIQATLSTRFTLAGVIWQQKPKSADVPAPADIIRELALRADFVIAATGD
jgi:hypothetical protein